MNRVAVGRKCDWYLWRICGEKLSNYIIKVRFVSRHKAIIYIAAENKNAICVSAVKKNENSLSKRTRSAICLLW